MRKILLFVLCIFVVFGCTKRKEPEFTLKGRVKIEKSVAPSSKVRVEICKGLKWYSDPKWETTTNKWGDYKMIIPLDWFSCSYRVRVSAVDTVILKYNDYYGHYDKLIYKYISGYKYGTVQWATNRVNFRLTEDDRVISEDERLKREGLKEKRMND